MSSNKRKSSMYISLVAIIVCILHAVMLHTQYNQYYLTSIAKMLLFLLGTFGYTKIAKAGRFQDLLFDIKYKQAIKKASIFGLMVFVFVIIAYMSAKNLLEPNMILEALSNVGIERRNYHYVFLYVIFINAALEELFFRGFVFLSLHKLGMRYYAHILSSFLFAFYHVFVIKSGAAPAMLLLGIICLALGGFVLNHVAKKCNCIFGSAIVHIGANLAINIIGVYYLYFV
ncbi:MAG: CPBP family glutamic-type intramembrane protease [Oscillospiraceae bacterium]|nr:CPBP family glutamic-type intramembrane protease [Oscillospiraceae bacterium]